MIGTHYVRGMAVEGFETVSSLEQRGSGEQRHLDQLTYALGWNLHSESRLGPKLKWKLSEVDQVQQGHILCALRNAAFNSPSCNLYIPRDSVSS